MDKSGQGTLLSNRLKHLILEVFKSIRKSNAPCFHDIFVLQEVPYDLRIQKLEQPNRRTANYGLRTFSYLGSKLWNEFLSDFNYTCDTDLDGLKFFLKHWEGPSLDPTYRNYVWTLLADLLFGAAVLHGWYFICFDLTFYTCIILIPSFISMYTMTLHCIYCTFQSRILACWLMLSVAKTTINKVYLILSYYLFHTPAVIHQKKPHTVYSVPQPSATRRNRTLSIPYPNRQPPEKKETVHYLFHTPAVSHQKKNIHYLFRTPAVSHQKKPYIIYSVPPPSAIRRNRPSFDPSPSRQTKHKATYNKPLAIAGW